MIWSWSEPRSGTAEGAAVDGQGAGPARWSWMELGPGGDPREEKARLEALHAEEVEAAFLRGRIEGQEMARDAARRELASAVAAARSVLREVQENRESWKAALEENLVALATAMARRILERELRDDPRTFVAMASEAVASFPADEPIRVRLHPADLEAMAALEPEGDPSALLGEERDIRWVPDEEMVQGGCVVEGPDRIVDGRLDEALRRIYYALIHD